MAGQFFRPYFVTPYYGRGPLHLRWNGRYGQFGHAFFEELYEGADRILKQPWLLETDSSVGFASALWLYMVPQHPKPSAHDVVTGFF